MAAGAGREYARGQSLDLFFSFLTHWPTGSATGSAVPVGRQYSLPFLQNVSVSTHRQATYCKGASLCYVSFIHKREMPRFASICSLLVAAIAVGVTALFSFVNLDHLDGPIHGQIAWLLHKPNFLIRDIPDLSNKTFVVVGATHGIGYWTALHLTKNGATVVLGCRDMATCRDVEQDINTQSALAGGGRAVGYYIDLAKHDTIADFAKSFLGIHPELHGLILNAGVLSPVYKLTDDAFEMTLAVNWLGGFYLQQLLQSVLETTGTPEAPARLVVVASNAHVYTQYVDLTEEDFGLASNPQRAAAYTVNSMFPTYARSKLLNILHARGVAKRSEAAAVASGTRPRVVSISLMPGFIATNIASGPIDSFIPVEWIPAIKTAMSWAYTITGSMDAESGAITTLYAATSAEAAGLNGAYLVPFGRQWTGSPQSQDQALLERAWAVAQRSISGWPRLSDAE